MNRRSFMAALLALPFVPVAAKQAKARINVAWAAASAPNGFAAIWGLAAAGEPAASFTVDVPSTMLRPNPVVDQSFEESCPRPMADIPYRTGSELSDQAPPEKAGLIFSVDARPSWPK